MSINIAEVGLGLILLRLGPLIRMIKSSYLHTYTKLLMQQLLSRPKSDK